MPDNFPKVYLYRRIVQARLFIDTHFAEKIDLDNIADEAFFSKYHFIRLFRSVYHQTPHQYLSSVRIEKAKQLLATGMSAVFVCNAVGFESPSSFTGLFKRSVGVPPSIYQSEQIKRHAEMLEKPLKFVPNCFISR